jgi:hypothetical protein
MSEPTIFINVFQGDAGNWASEKVHTSRTEAVEAAEEFSDDYEFTLTDAGKIDLRSAFSEGYQEKRDFDAMIDARIDGLKDLRSFTMTERR